MKYSILLPYYNRKEHLKATLESFEYFYSNRNDLEIVIVDDVSAEDQRVEDLANSYALKINVVRLSKKTGINPCYPYNIAARHSSGEILILSSPETQHTSDIFRLADDFIGFQQRSYYAFSVFCPTDAVFNQAMLSADYPERLDTFNREKPRMFAGLGAGKRPEFNSEFGSWYLHSKYRHSSLNFLTAVSRDTYFNIGGFREEFRFGTGYDDNDFLDRLLPHIDEVRYFDDAIALHLNHAPVHNGAPTTNLNLYNRLKNSSYIPGDGWGRI